MARKYTFHNDENTEPGKGIINPISANLDPINSRLNEITAELEKVKLKLASMKNKGKVEAPVKLLPNKKSRRKNGLDGEKLVQTCFGIENLKLPAKSFSASKAPEGSRFRDKEHLAEECYLSLRAMADAEAKGLDSIERYIYNHTLLENYADPNIIKCLCEITFEDGLETDRIPELGYSVGKNVAVKFYVPTNKDKLAEVSVAAIISTVDYDYESEVVEMMALTIDFMTENLDYDVETLFAICEKIYLCPDIPNNDLPNSFKDFLDLMENLWKSPVGMNLLKLMLEKSPAKIRIPEADYSTLPEPTFGDIHLNKEQSDAYYLALQKVHLSYIQAPPGTGKTLVGAMIANASSQMVFLTAETNKAVENLAKYSFNHRRQNRDVIRFYSYSAQLKSPVLAPYSEKAIKKRIQRHGDLSERDRKVFETYDSIQADLATYEKRKKIDFDSVKQLRNQMFRLDNKRTKCMLKVCDLNIVATTSDFGKKMLKRKIPADKFEKCIVDEASQMTLARFLLMAAYFPNIESFTFIGDTNQLSPYVPMDCKNSEHNQFFFQSILQFVQRTKVIPYKNLVKSYRMHPTLLNMVSISFYQSTLVSGVEEKERQLALAKLSLPGISTPMVWYDIKNCAATKTLRTSFSNQKEAILTKTLVNNLMDSGFGANQIGVVCMYKGQVQLVSALLKSTRVSVNTVDGVQGDEKEIIILLTTRTSHKFSDRCSSFLGDANRITVAISRAKNCLIVLGDAEYLRKNCQWKRVVHFYEERNAIWTFLKMFGRLALSKLLCTATSSITAGRNTSIFNRPKRFYKTVEVAPETVNGKEEFVVLLDGKTVKTMAKNVLRLPTEALAQVIANEWDSQEKVINMTHMRCTGLAFTALDNPFHQTKEDIIKYVMEYSVTDTILYVSPSPINLNLKQQELWIPVIDWANQKYNLGIEPTESLFELPKFSPDAVATLTNYFNGYNFWQLIGYQYSVEATKSVLLSLATAENALNPERAVELARLEQAYQEKLYGTVEWCHSIESMETGCRLASGALFVNLSATQTD
uniref:AAA_12 domain-containing protein n=1 Tax=Rhabditophanes sp. KR3021 TaxID=114890 RepID=A0AC35UD72_9BILA